MPPEYARPTNVWIGASKTLCWTTRIVMSLIVGIDMERNYVTVAVCIDCIGMLCVPLCRLCKNVCTKMVLIVNCTACVLHVLINGSQSVSRHSNGHWTRRKQQASHPAICAMTNAMLEAPGNVKASLSTVTEAVHYAMCRSAGQSATDTIELANRLVCSIRFAETHKNSRSFFYANWTKIWCGCIYDTFWDNRIHTKRALHLFAEVRNHSMHSADMDIVYYSQKL